jgi:hypothetical protein
VKCHSIERSGGDLVVNWTPGASAADRPRRLTEYAHEPHFSLGSREGCHTCHALTDRRGYLASYETLDPLHFESGFEPLSVDTCARCHRPGAAASGCLACHVYHAPAAPDGGREPAAALAHAAREE